MFSLSRITFTDLEEKLIFKKGQGGSFSVKVVYNDRRPKLTKLLFYNHIWHPVRFTKSSILLWISWHARLGIDTNYQKKGGGSGLQMYVV